MVIMASGIVRGRVRTMAMVMVELCNMAAIIQIIAYRDMQPWFTVYFSDIEHLCYDQTTLVKTRYPLTHIT